jgi:hypothetical protein
MNANILSSHRFFGGLLDLHFKFQPISELRSESVALLGMSGSHLQVFLLSPA